MTKSFMLTPIEQMFHDAYQNLITCAGYVSEDYALQAQASIGPYRVDFLHPATSIVIECDGKAYHGTTSQTIYDLERWLYLARCGYSVIRLSGSWIFANAEYCAQIVRTQIGWRLDEKRYLVAARRELYELEEEPLEHPERYYDPIAALQQELVARWKR